MCVQLLQAFASTAEQLALLGNVERETKGYICILFFKAIKLYITLDTNQYFYYYFYDIN